MCAFLSSKKPNMIELNEEITCRLCLSTEGSMDSLYNDSNTQNSLCDKIYKCFTLRLENIIGLPSYVCEFCKSKLVICLHFKKQCFDTDNLIKEKYASLFLNKGSPVHESGKSIDFSPTAQFKSVNAIVADDNPNRRLTRNSKKREIAQKVSETNSETDIGTDIANDQDSVSESNQLESIEEEDVVKIRKVNDKKKSNSDSFKLISGKKVTYHTKCKICGKMQQNMKQHQRIHSGEKPYKCGYCGKAFAQTANYKHHLNIHTGHKPYKCSHPLCEKAFGDPNSLKSHIIKHTGERKYRCEICGNGFGYSHTLKAHIRTHLQDKKHACTFCEKLFLTKHGVRKHERIHTGEKPYQCEICSKSFTSSGNLSTHKRVHTKERPFKCTICEMDFGYRSVLNSHMKIHNSPIIGNPIITDEIDDSLLN